MVGGALRKETTVPQIRSIGISKSDFDYNERIMMFPAEVDTTKHSGCSLKSDTTDNNNIDHDIDGETTPIEEVEEEDDSLFLHKPSPSAATSRTTTACTSTTTDQQKDSLKLPTDKECEKAWTHGFEVPYVFFEYHRQKQSRQKVNISVDGQDIVYVPKAVLREPKSCANGGSTRNNSIDSEDTDNGVSVFHHNSTNTNKKLDSRKEAKVLTKDVARSNLAPYFSIPSATLTVPSFMDVINNPEYADFKNHFIKICYQNHYDLNETTYTFGGLYLSDSLKTLGIPNHTDLSKISVHFPYELPPYVNSDIMKNPLMNQSNLFFSFDPINSRVVAVENINDENYPFNVNCLQSTKISDRHIFFYGGWLVSVDSVEYNEKEDRWIIHKSFKLNEYGYILNAFALKFTRVEIHSKSSKSSDHQQMKMARPRIGTCMVSSTIEESEGNSDGILPSHMMVHSSNSSNTVSTEVLPSSSSSSSPLTVVENNTSSPTSRLPPQQYPSAVSAAASRRSPPPMFLPPVHPEIPEHNKLKIITTNDSGKATTTLDSMKAQASAVTHSPSVRVAGALLNKSKSIFHRSSSNTGKHTTVSSPPQNIIHKNSTGSLTPPTVKNSSNNSSTTTPSPVVRPRGLSETKTGDDKIPPSALHTGGSNASKSKIASFAEDEASLSSTKSTASVTSNMNNNNNNRTEMPPSKKEEFYFGSNGVAQDNFRSESSCKQSTLLDKEPKGVTIFIFGGFVLDLKPDDDGIYHFSATSEMLKIELGLITPQDPDQTHGLNYSKIHFSSKATIQSLRLAENCPCRRNDDTTTEEVCDSCWWPEPRGYFASALIDDFPNIIEACEIRVFDTSLYKVESNTSYSQLSEGDEGSNNPTSSSISVNAAGFFSKKVLVVHGGINAKGKTFADFIVFSFLTGRWELMTTYCHDYFNVPKQPFEDDDSSMFTKEKEANDSPLMEAELRACHHTMLYYKWEDRGYLFFLGGFMNDFLRLHEKEPYYSDKLDITRFTRFQFSTNNTNLLRIPVLNLQTQTWSFLRYYYDVNGLISDEFQELLKTNSGWSNARFSNYGGSISINGKVITMCHGLVVPVPERLEDLEKLKKDCPQGYLLWGAHVFFTFPIM